MISLIDKRIYKFKTTIIKSEIDRVKLMSLLKEYKASKRSVGLIVDERKLLREQRQKLRLSIKEVMKQKEEHTYWLGDWYVTVEYDNTPDKEEIRSNLKSMVELLREKVKRYNVEPIQVRKKYYGIEYHTVGGVFTKKDSIKDINIHTEDNLERDKRPFDRANYIGIEIEMYSKFNRRTLNSEFLKDKLTLKVKNKTDGSITVNEPDMFGLETTALFKYEETNDVVNKVINVLKRGEAKVNNSCGLHIHLDMRNKDPKVCYYNLVSCLPVLNLLVPQSRVSGDWSSRYCAQNVTTDFQSATNFSRYTAINATAYNKFKTLEVRLHSGTVNAAKIINFIHILQTIVDRTTKLDNTVNNINEFREAFPSISSKLYEYMIKRSELIAKRSIDTVGDMTTDDVFEVAS